MIRSRDSQLRKLTRNFIFFFTCTFLHQMKKKKNRRGCRKINSMWRQQQMQGTPNGTDILAEAQQPANAIRLRSSDWGSHAPKLHPGAVRGVTKQSAILTTCRHLTCVQSLYTRVFFVFSPPCKERPVQQEITAPNHP